MTEISPISTQTALDDPLDKRVETVGRVHPHVEVKVVDPDDRRDRPARRRPASSARAATASCSATGTTRRRPPRRSTPAAGCTAATSPSWTTTATCSIVGRIKDMIIRGGENIYPREIEEFLHGLPEVSRRPRHRRAERALRRGGDGLGQAARRRGADRGAARRRLPRPDRDLQDPPLLEARRRLPDDDHRQDPEVPDARDRDRGARASRRCRHEPLRDLRRRGRRTCALVRLFATPRASPSVSRRTRSRRWSRRACSSWAR